MPIVDPALANWYFVLIGITIAGVAYIVFRLARDWDRGRERPGEWPEGPPEPPGRMLWPPPPDELADVIPFPIARPGQASSLPRPRPQHATTGELFTLQAIADIEARGEQIRAQMGLN